MPPSTNSGLSSSTLIGERAGCLVAVVIDDLEAEIDEEIILKRGLDLRRRRVVLHRVLERRVEREYICAVGIHDELESGLACVIEVGRVAIERAALAILHPVERDNLGEADIVAIDPNGREAGSPFVEDDLLELVRAGIEIDFSADHGAGAVVAGPAVDADTGAAIMSSSSIVLP